MNISILDFQDYRAYLRSVLEEGLRRNPSFSLRALAKKCDLTPSYLSRILNGQRGLSATHASRIAAGLALPPEETGHLLALLAGGANTARAEKSSRLLESETFRAIAEWHHFAILALAKTRGFNGEPAWIASRLPVSRTTAKLAMERLVSLGFLRKNGKSWEVSDRGHLETPHDIASAAVKENHRQHLSLASAALDSVTVELREFANASVPVKMRDVPRAKAKIRAFLDRFIEEFEVDLGEEVLQVNLQLYPLSKIEKGRA